MPLYLLLLVLYFLFKPNEVEKYPGSKYFVPLNEQLKEHRKTAQNYINKNSAKYKSETMSRQVENYSKDDTISTFSDMAQSLKHNNSSDTYTTKQYLKSHDNSTYQTCAQKYSPTKIKNTWYDAQGNKVQDKKAYFRTIEKNGRYWETCSKDDTQQHNSGKELYDSFGSDDSEDVYLNDGVWIDSDGHMFKK